MRTLLTAQYMTAQRRAAAAFDGTHDLQLAEADMPPMSFAPGRTLLAEDIRYFELRRHAVG